MISQRHDFMSAIVRFKFTKSWFEPEVQTRSQTTIPLGKITCSELRSQCRTRDSSSRSHCLNLKCKLEVKRQFCLARSHAANYALSAELAVSTTSLALTPSQHDINKVKRCVNKISTKCMKMSFCPVFTRFPQRLWREQSQFTFSFALC